MENYTGVSWSTAGDNPVENYSACTTERHSHLVAKVKPTAMKPMPTSRLYWPRSFITGTELFWPMK